MLSETTRRIVFVISMLPLAFLQLLVVWLAWRPIS
jgi:hypothetical protein